MSSSVQGIPTAGITIASVQGIPTAGVKGIPTAGVPSPASPARRHQPGVTSIETREHPRETRPIMSRAFVKDDGPDAQIVIPPRAPLPRGVPNYVTPEGLRLLRAEMADLEAERSKLSGIKSDDADRRTRLAILAGRINDLRERINLSKTVDPARQDPNEIRFGATVTFRIDSGSDERAERTVAIVGVDQAQGSSGMVAFLSPIARSLNGKRAGDQVTLQTPDGSQTLTVVEVRYA